MSKIIVAMLFGLISLPAMAQQYCIGPNLPGTANSLCIRNGIAMVPGAIQAVSGTNMTLTAPVNGAHIQFLNAAGSIIFDTLDSANGATSNFLQIANNIAGGPVNVTAFGSDTNIDITYNPKGAGVSNFISHVRSTGANPTPSACGTTPAITADSSDTRGTVTLGTGSPTACTLTFAVAAEASRNRFCGAWSQGQQGYLWISAISAAAVTFTAVGFTSGSFTYQCWD